MQGCRSPTFAKNGRMWATCVPTGWGIAAAELGEVEAAMDTGQPTGSASAEKTEEDGFGLIVAGVRGGHRVEAVSGGLALKKCVAGAAASGFEREMKQRGERADIFALDGRFEPQPGGQRGDEVRIRLRFRAAQAVIEVKDEEHQSETGGQFGQGSQQGYGVGSATDSHTDALARADETMPAQITFERLEHRNIIAERRDHGEERRAEESPRKRQIDRIDGGVPICPTHQKRNGFVSVAPPTLGGHGEGAQD